MYPHNNLNRVQREALDRLHAPLFRFSYYWEHVTLTDPDGRGVHFFPRIRRTFTFHIKGYPVIKLSGRVQDKRIPLRPLWPPPEPNLVQRLLASQRGLLRGQRRERR